MREAPPTPVTDSGPSFGTYAGRFPDTDLRLGEGRREEDVDVGPLTSRYDQPFGTWHGTVAGRDVEAVGVAERHLARW
ncbi:hypothetical protein [Natronomonas marina]|jgi:hypothetical protein|uniref:hypothetical protein n=1 Tax=Natronomonas marina TaxID=2961939 RepID=UPI0020C97D0D|nr:hypothetical protein [Natronomonas marina]